VIISRIRFPFYLFFLNPVYVAARSLRSLRSNYVDLCEDCIVITAIHIRFITPVEIESLQMETNVFEYPLATNKSEFALRY